MFKKVDPSRKYCQMEEEIVNFWKEKQIFEKSIQQRSEEKNYSFYDGPPFATGTPHYGHIVASTMKDAVPRYWSMKGYRVQRRWGWDCHGLPIENIAEKDLGIKSKKEIEQLGVDKFNEACRAKVLSYTKEWEKVVERLGRWADMKNSYKTMDLDFMESVWWVFKELFNKGLIYEGYRSMHVCPRCETTLSQMEVSEGYQMVKDLSVIAKFELIDEPNTFVLAWTTIPWTLIGNVALAVGKDIDYVKIEKKDENEVESERLILAKENLEKFFQGKEYKIIEEIKGTDLVGKKYQPLFNYYSEQENLQNKENGWKIYASDFVSTNEGTGIVHIAPAFGENDMQLGKEQSLPFVQHVKMDGNIKEEMGEFAGLNVKPKEDHQKTDVEIIKYLAKNKKLFFKEKYEHSYPHCWRCETPLINYATTSWFVNISKVKQQLLENAKSINWEPQHIKNGRWGKWLLGAKDWSISRQRYWASVMPIWKCSCGQIKVIGSIKELQELSGQKVQDLHKHTVDKITFECQSCQGKMKRIPDVLDTWFDSGCMPYAQAHYPFENKEEFEKSFPAQFIAEGIDQTRAWFYYLHVIGTAVFEKNAFNNVIVNGIVLAEDGKKMAKRLKNYPDPMEMMEKYGADVLRFYLLFSPVVRSENLNFSEKDLAELSRGMFRMLMNSYSFFMLYASVDNWQPDSEVKTSDDLLDQWILSELNILIGQVDKAMENYELNKAVRFFPAFIENLSNWYIRRSRRRFWKSQNDQDKVQAYQTLWTVLVKLSELIAPFCPFIAEEMYKNLTGKESVHLVDYPCADKALINEEIIKKMVLTRAIIEGGLSVRAELKIKVRQPLATLKIRTLGVKLEETFQELIKDEMNVKKIEIGFDFFAENHWAKRQEDNYELALDMEITPELKLEGQMRELVRHIQEGRKEAGFQVEDRIHLFYQGGEKIFDSFKEVIAKEILASEISLKNKNIPEEIFKKVVKIDEEEIVFWIQK